MKIETIKEKIEYLKNKREEERAFIKQCDEDYKNCTDKEERHNIFDTINRWTDACNQTTKRIEHYEILIYCKQREKELDVR